MKKHYIISDSGSIIGFTKEDYEMLPEKSRKLFEELGNHFETKKEARQAVEKLKAWKRLKDYWGTEVLGWEIRDMPTGGNWQTVNIKFNVKTRKEPMELLDLLFGGED